MSCEKPSIQPKVCQCALVNPFLADRIAYSCQWKVNSKNMTMSEYYTICEEEKVITSVSKTEEERLKKVWTKNGHKWTVCGKSGEIKFLGPDK